MYCSFNAFIFVFSVSNFCFVKLINSISSDSKSLLVVKVLLIKLAILSVLVERTFYSIISITLISGFTCLIKGNIAYPYEALLIITELTFLEVIKWLTYKG